MAVGGKIMIHRAPVSGGPCAGATFITAMENWDGAVGGVTNGHYKWNAYRRMWVWNLTTMRPIPTFVTRKISEAEFAQRMKKHAGDFG